MPCSANAQAGRGLSQVGHLPADVGLNLDAVGSSLTSFGKTLLTGTKEFIDTVRSLWFMPTAWAGLGRVWWHKANLDDQQSTHTLNSLGTQLPSQRTLPTAAYLRRSIVSPCSLRRA
mgnify:CR=1 FL=1